MRRVCFAIVAAGTGLCAQADEDVIRPGRETWKVNLGSILNTTSAEVGLKGRNGIGTTIDLENATGLKREVSSWYVSALWRFADNHRLGLQMFENHRKAEKAIDQQLVIKDQVIPAGTTLTTDTQSKFYVLNYHYSLVHNDHAELSAMAGLYGARLRYQFNATNPPTDVAANTTAPLPMLGLQLDTFLTPRWTVSTFLEGLDVEVNSVGGRVVNAGISTDYMVSKHFGLGLGYNVTSVGIEADKSGFSGHAGWRQSSWFAYAQARF